MADGTDNTPSRAEVLRGTLPDVLDPNAPGVTTMDRGAEMSDDRVRSDPEANRPRK